MPDAYQWFISSFTQCKNIKKIATKQEAKNKNDDTIKQTKIADVADGNAYTDKAPGKTSKTLKMPNKNIIFTDAFISLFMSSLQPKHKDSTPSARNSSDQ